MNIRRVLPSAFIVQPTCYNIYPKPKFTNIESENITLLHVAEYISMNSAHLTDRHGNHNWVIFRKFPSIVILQEILNIRIRELPALNSLDCRKITVRMRVKITKQGNLGCPPGHDGIFKMKGGLVWLYPILISNCGNADTCTIQMEKYFIAIIPYDPMSPYVS